MAQIGREYRVGDEKCRLRIEEVLLETEGNDDLDYLHITPSTTPVLPSDHPIRIMWLY